MLVEQSLRGRKEAPHIQGSGRGLDLLSEKDPLSHLNNWRGRISLKEKTRVLSARSHKDSAEKARH